MTTTSGNNVAAQAGDEPMRAAFEALAVPDGLNVERGFKNGYRDADTRAAYRGFKLAQGSPRATADVERNQAVRDLVRLWDCEVFHPDEYNEEMCRIEAIIRATTKPGA